MRSVPRVPLRAALATTALLLTGLPLPAYLLNLNAGGEIGWDLDSAAPNVVGGKVTYYVDTSGVTDVSAAQFGAAVRAAVQAWEDVPGARLAFTEDPSRPASTKKGSDRINRLGFGSAGEINPFVYALAFRTYLKERVIDADVLYNPDVHVNDGANGGAGTPLPWSVATPGQDNTADVQAVTTHEWGHCIGFDHVPLGHSTMHYALPAGVIMTRSPEPDDAAGLRHRYPDATAGSQYGTLAGTVDIAGTPDERGVQVTAIDYATARPAASAFSQADGTWRIEGLDPGVYRVVASPILESRASGSVYNPHWKDAVTDLVPVFATDGSGLVLPRVVEAGSTVSGIALTLAVPTSPPGEPDDSSGTARVLPLGGALAGRIEEQGDFDFYAFDAVAGSRVSIHVDAFHLGSDLNPRLTLFNPLGVTVAEIFNIRAGSDTFGEDGFDLDAEIVDFSPALTGRYVIRVRTEWDIPPGSPPPEDRFYVITLLPASGAPSAHTSEMTVAPDILDADGESTATVVFRPRSLTGGASGPGLDVTMALVADGDADGSPGTVSDRGDGTYEVVLTAASAAGSDIVRASVDGTPISSVTVAYRGPAVAARSDFAALPPRVRAGGLPMALTLVPRDANGVAHGPGHAVAFDILGEGAAAETGAATDAGDGSYTGGLVPGDARESLALDALVDGVSIGASLPVGVGFPLDEVVDETLASLDGILDGLPPVKSVAKLQKARDLLAGVAGFDAATSAVAILDGMRKSAKQLEGAAKKSAAVGVELYLLAEAAREAAGDALDAAAPDADLPPEVKALGKGQTLFGKGETLLEGLRFSAAATKYRAALVQALRIAP